MLKKSMNKLRAFSRTLWCLTQNDALKTLTLNILCCWGFWVILLLKLFHLSCKTFFLKIYQFQVNITLVVLILSLCGRSPVGVCQLKAWIFLLILESYHYKHVYKMIPYKSKLWKCLPFPTNIFWNYGSISLQYIDDKI